MSRILSAPISLTYPGKLWNIIRDREKTMGEKAMEEMQELLPKVSKTYAIAIPELPMDVRRDLTMAYYVVRELDIFHDDLTLDPEKVRVLSEEFLTTLEYSTQENIARLVPKLEALEPEKRGYRKLLRKLPTFVRAFHELPEKVQSSILRWSKVMALGFGNKELMNIQSMEDYYRRCHYDAGVVGSIITEDFWHRGYLSDKQKEKLMPDPMSEKLGVNLSNDVGIALQFANDIDGIIEDMENDIYRMPHELLVAKGLSYETLANASRDEGSKRRAAAFLEDMVQHAKPLIKNCNTYIKELPYDPNGLRNFLGFSTLVSTAIVRNTFNLLTPARSAKPNLKEVFHIYNKVREINFEHQDLEPFITHTLEKPAWEYKPKI